jgi:endonuclease/exonuclease/phosphatase (EEP) superfamily protein YafD
VVLAVIIIVQAYKAAPYTPFGQKQVLTATASRNDSNTISLFICNVLQTNTAYNKVLEKINDYQPDLVITTETNKVWQDQLKSLEESYPYRQPIPLENLYGMHLYSRFPLANIQVRYLVEPDIPSIRANVQLRTGEWITLFIVHPRPPVPQESKDSKDRDAEIIMVGKEARKEKGGVIVAGDFNDVAWSENTKLFQQVTGFLDPRRGRGFYNTYHAGIPIFRWPLDHIFHSNHFKLVKIERLGNVGSDHFPMFVHLQYQPEAKHQQKEVKPDEDTEKEANETIREGKTNPKSTD